MALTSEQAKAKAEECRALAAAATKDSHRIMFNHMADTWERIAAEARIDADADTRR